MSEKYIIISRQKLTKLVKIWQSYAKNNFYCFLRHGVYLGDNNSFFWFCYYRMGQKMWHYTFVHIFANYWPIFKILSLARSVDNLQ